MNQQFAYGQSKQDKAMTDEQFQQVVGAILDGKYSWACVLILRFAGYNPLHYIPYRTYNRLIKDNCNCSGGKSSRLQTETEKNSEAVKVGSIFSQRRSNQIEDLNYLQEVHRQDKSIIGGSRLQWFFW